MTGDDGHDARGIEFVAARGFSVVAFLFSVLLLGGCVALLLYSKYEPGNARLYIAIAISAAFVLVTLRQALRRGVVLKISSEGLFDQRLADTLIPWSAITGVSFYNRPSRFLRVRTSEVGGLVVRLNPVFQAKTSRSARMGRVFNSIFGFDGYSIGVFGLRGGSQQDLEAAIARYWKERIDGISAREQVRLSRLPYDGPFQGLPRGTKKGNGLGPAHRN